MPFPNNSYCYNHHNDYLICMGPGVCKPQGQVSFMNKLLECKIWLHLIEVLALSRPEPMASVVFPNEVLTENEDTWIWLVDSCVQYYSTFQKLISALGMLNNSVAIHEQQWGWGFLLHVPLMLSGGLAWIRIDRHFGLPWWTGTWKEQDTYKEETHRFCEWVNYSRNRRSISFPIEHRSNEQGTLAIRWYDILLYPEQYPTQCGWLLSCGLPGYLHNQLIWLIYLEHASMSCNQKNLI